MKRFLSMMLASCMVLSIAGCSQKTDNSSSADTSSSAASDVSTDTSSVASDTSATDTSSAPAEEIEVEEVPYVLGGELTPTMKVNSVLNKGNQARLAKVIKKLQAGEEVTVAYLGGSITQGSSAGNDLCYARLTTDWLIEQFPDAKIRYVNAGIGATGSYIGVHRCDQDVLSKDPDLVFIDFSVNDTSDRSAINKCTYESLIRKIWQHATAPAIVTLVMTQENGTSVQDLHYEIAARYDIPMISYRNAILDVIDKGYIAWTDISNDNIHPNVPGHAVLTDMITNYLQGVIDNVDSIDTTDPALPETTADLMKYENATLIMTGDDACKANGIFTATQDVNFGNFYNPWLARMRPGDAADPDASALIFEVEAQNIGILFGKLTGSAGKVDVYLNDMWMKTIDASFPGGWGNYVEFAEIASFDKPGKYTIKIVPKDPDSASAFYVSAIAVS